MTKENEELKSTTNDKDKTTDKQVTLSQEQFDKLIGMAQKVEILTEELASLKNSNEEDNLVEANGEQKPAGLVEMRCIGGSPIIEMEFVEEKAIRDGFEVILSVKAKCKTLDKKEHLIPYFNGTKESYERQQVLTFKLVNQIDGTGASRVKKDKVFTGAVLPELIRTPGESPKFSGKMVKAFVENVERFYTIIVDGKEYELSEKQLQFK